MCAQLQVACIQFAPLLGDPEATWQALEPLLAEAAGADLVVLPELCNSGYHFPGAAVARAAAEPVADSVFLRRLQDACRRHGFMAATGFCEAAGRRLYNAAVLVDAGGVQGLYRKVHLFDREKEIFTPGDLGFPVFAGAGTTLGMLVCFDWSFPEAWRILALRGVALVAHPANLVLPERCQQAVPAHALLHRYFVATANRVGEERGLRFTGGSLVAGPDGEILARAPEEGSAVIRASCDLERAADKQLTARNHLLADRRPECYGALLSPSPAAGSRKCR